MEWRLQNKEAQPQQRLFQLSWSIILPASFVLAELDFCLGCSAVSQVTAYVSFCLLLGTRFFSIHMRVSNSRIIQNDHRSLRLAPPPQTL